MLYRPPVNSFPSLIQVTLGLGAPNTRQVMLTSLPSTVCTSVGATLISGGKAIKKKNLNIKLQYNLLLI